MASHDPRETGQPTQQVQVPRPRASIVSGRRWIGVAAYHAVSFRRVWRGAVFTRLGQPLLMLFAVGWGVGLLVDRSDRGGIPWGGQVLPYVVFVVPAILSTQAMTTGVGESSWRVMGAIKWQGTYHAMLATPLRTRDILLGHLAHVSVQLLAGATVFIAVAALFGVWRSGSVLWTIPVALLTGLGFALFMTGVSARVESQAWLTLTYRLGITPLMLFSGTFFPVEQLPAVLRPLSAVTPLWHGVAASRALSTGLIDAGSLGLHVAVLVGFVVAGWWWAARGLHRRLVR
ncbi:MAG: ABC transporter [Actinomycetales bacterium]|nr:MAG: ABC transporter [Actinomycetales bacterium]